MASSDQTNIACNSPRADRIARLNDTLRKTGKGGAVMVTRGVRALGSFEPLALLAVSTAVGFQASVAE